MMKSVILLLMILGVGGWVLSHSASYIAHRRAAHGPLTRDFFHGNSEIPPAFRQALEETIVFLDNRRDWAAGSALDAGTTDLCWIEIKDRDLLLRAGLFSPGNLGRLQIRRRLRRSGPALLQYGHRITFPHWKGFGMFSPLDRNICLVYHNTYVRFQGRETPWT